MIQQRAKIAKMKTDDGHFNFTMPIGTEVWIDSHTFRKSTYRNKTTREFFQVLTVEVVDEENKVTVPVEILEFTCDFRTT